MKELNDYIIIGGVDLTNSVGLNGFLIIHSIPCISYTLI